jgi:hypothetical protein
VPKEVQLREKKNRCNDPFEDLRILDMLSFLSLFQTVDNCIADVEEDLNDCYGNKVNVAALVEVSVDGLIAGLARIFTSHFII